MFDATMEFFLGINRRQSIIDQELSDMETHTETHGAARTSRLGATIGMTSCRFGFETFV